MAKKSKEGPSKSDSIRSYLSEHPKAGPTEVVNALKEQGVTVSVPLVSALKAKAKGKRGRKKGSAPKTLRGRKSLPAGNGKFSFEVLLAAKKLADQLGGVKKAREAMDLLEQLS